MNKRSKLIFHCRENHILTYGILDDIFHIKRKSKENSDNILILFTPFIGDTILYLNVLRELERHYHEDGKRCIIVTLKQNRAFIEQYCNYDEVILFDYNQFIMNLAYRKEMTTKLQAVSYEKVINPYFDNLIESDIIAFLVNAKEKIAADRYKVYPGRVLSKSLRKNSLRKQAYDKMIHCDDSHMDFIKQSYFMKEMGIPKFQAKISFMEKTQVEAISLDVPFAIIAPGASKAGKRWEPTKFASIIKTLVHSYNFSIYICGSKDEEPICDEIIKELDDGTKKKVIDYMGKTSLLEYLEMIRNAKLVVSNDSSPVHMAASVGTPCICIIGGWDYHRLLPYKVEAEEAGTRLPVPIYSEVLNCFNCFDHSVGYNNEQCKKCVKLGRPYPCIASISISDVEQAMEDILNG